MVAISAFRHAYSRVRHLSRRLCSTHNAVALLVLFTLGVLEPLACIVHCELWLPFVAATQPAQHGTHFLCVFGAEAQPQRPADAASAARTSWAAPHMACALCAAHGVADSTEPLFPTAPVPFHVVALAVTLTLLLPTLLHRQRAVPPRPPPTRSVPPLVPPPLSA